jgi:prolipoprotein diacylglyceryltransferase
MLLNMGQLLSIPFIIMAVLMIWYGMKGRFPVGKPDCPENRPQKEDKRK